MTAMNRRRFVSVFAASVAGPFVPGRFSQAASYTWKGTALGAEASIRLGRIDPQDAKQFVQTCLDTLNALENEFSLYRETSALSRLNRTGYLDYPSPAFLELLSRIRSVHRATGGVFDPTVQPIWDGLARSFTSKIKMDTASSPSAGGFDNVHFDTRRVRFAEPRMSMTFNGIAQGYITDKIADLLKSHGFDNVLVNMGELRAIGPQASGSAWPVRLETGGQPKSGDLIYLENRSLATSDTLGTVFDKAGRMGHIIDPRTGLPAADARSVTVSARQATVADALSTAFCIMNTGAVATALESFGDAEIHGV